MTQVPEFLRPALTRLRRRLAVGVFLDVWPVWAAIGCVAAGTMAAICRMFVERASALLPWLWLTPIAALIPALVVGARRAYRPGDVAAIADSLGGGHGLLLTLAERSDPAWARSGAIDSATRFPLPRLRLRRVAVTLLPAFAFLAAAMLLPQRVRAVPVDTALAEEIAAKLTAAVVELKQQQLITPAEEQRLEEQIARIRESAERRVDPSSWEAADVLREQMASGVAEKQQAARWAQEAFARYAAAAQAGDAASAATQAAELTKALEKLAQSGLMAGAPPELKALMNGGKLPGDAAALKDLAAAMAKFLADANGRFGQVAGLGQEFGKFDPGEFPIGMDGTSAGEKPGRGGVSEGRADADLSWGKESAAFDRFKAHPLPPGSARRPDDWSPVVTMPGAPQESTATRGSATARDYVAETGQGAWRRSLAPRHQSVVKKYFATPIKKTSDKQDP